MLQSLDVKFEFVSGFGVPIQEFQFTLCLEACETCTKDLWRQRAYITHRITRNVLVGFFVKMIGFWLGFGQIFR